MPEKRFGVTVNIYNDKAELCLIRGEKETVVRTLFFARDTIVSYISHNHADSLWDTSGDEIYEMIYDNGGGYLTVKTHYYQSMGLKLFHDPEDRGCKFIVTRLM